MKIDRIRTIAIVISVILHILLLLLISQKDVLNLNLLPQTDDLTAPEKYNRITYNLIDTPDLPESENNDPNRKLASDKNLDAADENPLHSPDTENPYQQGISDIEEFVFQKSAPDQQKISDASHTTKEPSQSGYLQQKESSDNQKDPVLKQLTQLREMQANFQNISSSVSAKGGMSFNTYKWNFAPYMLDMKRKIQNNINPPPAFKNMGMISGKNLIRFVVEPSGKLKKIILIGSDTHISLDQTSLAAINSSTPFLPLPHDFPENVLEVTATFEYFIRK